jgi:CYTH domain-containing protein
MAKEIERRFLVRGEFPLDIGRPKLIKQGYIFAGKDKQLRIRLIDNTAFLCLKFTEDVVRDEFEYEIPLVDGLAIYEKCEAKLEKIRNSMNGKTSHLDVDTYPNGWVIAEVEFQSKEDSDNFVPVSWFGEEITGQFQYSNIALARRNTKF